LRKCVLVCVVMTHESDDAESWAKGLHGRIAQAIRDARHGRMSAQQIADETKRLGYPISRNQIANYESGRKQTLDIAELVVLAQALRVPPVTLLFGGHPDHPVEMLPGRTMPAVEALAWFTGDEQLTDDAVSEPDSPAATLLRLTRQRAASQRRLGMARHMASLHAEKDDEAKFTPAFDYALQVMDDVAEIDAAIEKQWSAVVAGRKEVKE